MVLLQRSEGGGLGLGGGGGVKDDLAQGGGQDATKVEDALAAIERELGA